MLEIFDRIKNGTFKNYPLASKYLEKYKDDFDPKDILSVFDKATQVNDQKSDIISSRLAIQILFLFKDLNKSDILQAFERATTIKDEDDIISSDLARYILNVGVFNKEEILKKWKDATQTREDGNGLVNPGLARELFGTRNLGKEDLFDLWPKVIRVRKDGHGLISPNLSNCIYCTEMLEKNQILDGLKNATDLRKDGCGFMDPDLVERILGQEDLTPEELLDVWKKVTQDKEDENGIMNPMLANIILERLSREDQINWFNRGYFKGGLNVDTVNEFLKSLDAPVSEKPKETIKNMKKLESAKNIQEDKIEKKVGLKEILEQEVIVFIRGCPKEMKDQEIFEGAEALAKKLGFETENMKDLVMKYRQER